MFTFVSFLDIFHIVSANGQLHGRLSGIPVGSRRELGNLGFNEGTLLEDDIRKPRVTEPVSKLSYRKSWPGFHPQLRYGPVQKISARIDIAGLRPDWCLEELGEANIARAR